jgi:peptidoglycan/LPS O-acetylase OafA/YrhL
VKGLELGQYGVHLFLIISGFCIHMAWARSTDSHAPPSFGAVWKRRLRRLYPPYFVALCGTLVALFVFHRLQRGPAPDLGAAFGYPSTGAFVTDVVVLLLLFQNATGASWRIGNGPFWSLALEEQLYALYFALLWLRRRSGWTVALATVAAVTVTWRALGPLVVPAGWSESWLVLGPSRWLEWTLGAVAVEAHLGRITLPRWLTSFAIGLPLLGVAAAKHLLWPTLAFWTEDLLFGLAFFVIVNATCRLPFSLFASRPGRALVSVKVVSYSLYLIQQPVMVAAKQLAVRLGAGVPLIIVVRLVAPVVAAYAFYWLVERRFINTASKPAAAPPASAEPSALVSR